MGSSPYSPVIPLVICLPLRPLTSALMVQRCSEAFSLRIGLHSPTQIAHPPFLTFDIFSNSVMHGKMPRTVFFHVTPDPP